MQANRAHVINDARPVKIIHSRRRIVGSSWVVVDLGIRIKDRDLDPQVSRKQYTQEKTRRSGTNNNNLFESALQTTYV
jgi:hypothetical protein